MSGLREDGPVLLIPAAWLTAFFTATGQLSQTPLMVAHLVMVIALVLFLASSWREMATDPVLRTWRGIILGGILPTAAGYLAFTTPICSCLADVSIGYWIFAPALGLIITGAYDHQHAQTYDLAGMLSAVGLPFIVTGAPELLLIVGAGQTLGILRATSG